MNQSRARSKYVLLVLVALVPRLWQLDRFITPDEILFLDHARAFAEGLVSGDFALTLGIGYPGVTSAWVHALGLFALFGLFRLGLVQISGVDQTFSQFLVAADSWPLPYYVAGRVASAFLVTALLVIAYVLAHRLLDTKRLVTDQAALLGVLLLSLDPYVLGYSRLMHIAGPLALLMLLAAMAWLLWLDKQRPEWLWVTGLFVGLAILTKTTALLLFPILAGIAVLFWFLRQTDGEIRLAVDKAWLGRICAGWLGALGLAVLVFFLLWPVMWQEPRLGLGQAFGKLWVDRKAGHGNLGMFWMGRFVEDPGPAFYLVAMLLKLSPLMLVGLVFSLASLRLERERYAELGLWAYAILYLLAMTIASKKSVRYLMPAFIAFGPLAALGLLRLGRWLDRIVKSWGRGARINSRVALGAGLGMLLIGIAAIYGPYYLSYYNPLLIGWSWAPRAILTGWGEGLGDAAKYLNRKPGIEQAIVAAWYDWTFAPFFEGETLPLSTENVIRADYTVFYVNQVQRNIPDPNLISYFQRRRPEHVVRLNGIEYAWIYPALIQDGSPPSTAIPTGVSMGDTVVLEGYEVQADATRPGVIVTLYWRALRSDLPNYFVYVRAVGAEDHIYARADSPPVMGFLPTSRWEAGRLVADAQLLLRPPETEPGVYSLEVGMYDPETWAVLEPGSGEQGAGGGLLLGEVTLP